MSTMSAVHLTGNAVRDPEVKVQNSSTTMAVLRLAMTPRRRTPDGTWQDGESVFVDVQCWGSLADNVLYSVRKGHTVMVHGRLIQSSWEETTDAGETKTRTMLRVRATNVGVDLNYYRVDADRTAGGNRSSNRSGAEAFGEPVGTRERHLVGVGPVGAGVGDDAPF